MDKKAKIGVQMMMLKQEIQAHGMYTVLEKLSNMGFHAVEVSQIATPPAVIEEMTRAQRDLGMEIVAMSAMVRNSFKGRADIPMDSLEEDLRENHMKRLSEMQCNFENGVVFLDAVSNLERISDHAVNIAGYVKEEASWIGYMS